MNGISIISDTNPLIYLLDLPLLTADIGFKKIKNLKLILLNF